MDDSESITEELADNLDEISEDNEVPPTDEKVTSIVAPNQTNNVPPVDFTSWGWLFVIWFVFFFVTHGYPPFRKPPEREERLRPIDVSPQAQSTAYRPVNALTTENYWQVAVTELHRSRFPFLFLKDQNKQAGPYYDQVYEKLKSRVQYAHYAADLSVKNLGTGIDGDLREMSRQHLSIDKKFLKFLEDIQEFNNEKGLPEDTEAIGTRMEQGIDLFFSALKDPTFLDQITDETLRSLVQRIVDLELLREEQYREIEIMQARMQERYKQNKFPLPDPQDRL